MKSRRGLADEQKKRLIQHSLMWIDRLERVDREVSASMSRVLSGFAIGGDAERRFNLIDEAFADTFFNAYLIAVSLRRISEHMDLMNSGWAGEIVSMERAFRAQYRSTHVTDLRSPLV